MALVAKSLVEAGPCRNKSKTETVLSEAEQLTIDGNNAFFLAVHAGDLSKVQSMLNEGQGVNVGNEKQENEIHFAISGIIKRAIEGIATLNRLQIEDKNLLQIEDKNLLDILIKNGSFVDYRDASGKRPINLCFDKDEFGVQAAQFLLDLRDASGARVVDLTSVRSGDGFTLLHDVAWAGNVGCAKLLLNKGTEVCTIMASIIELTNKQGQTPLHVASFRAAIDIVQLLKNAGADHTATEKNSRRLSKDTAEVMAANMGRDDTANYLKSLNVTLNTVSMAAKLKKKVAA